MGKFMDLTGMRFNRLVVLERDFSKGNRRTYWKCRCDCGNITVVDGVKLKSGGTKSCGCLNSENRKKHIENLTTHNMRHTKLYEIWCSMRARCETKRNKAYKWYGERGISVCKEWLGKDGFINFYNWSMENGYKDGLTIDRIDTNGNYEPSNCQWATMKEQANNTRRNIVISYKGENKTLTELCEEYGLKYNIMYNRITKLELPFEVAMSIKGFHKAMYHGKETDLRHIARVESLEYKDLLRLVLVEQKEITDAIFELKNKEMK